VEDLIHFRCSAATTNLGVDFSIRSSIVQNTSHSTLTLAFRHVFEVPVLGHTPEYPKAKKDIYRMHHLSRSKSALYGREAGLFFVRQKGQEPKLRIRKGYRRRIKVSRTSIRHAIPFLQSPTRHISKIFTPEHYHCMVHLFRLAFLSTTINDKNLKHSLTLG
jgi:hypothetical protein